MDVLLVRPMPEKESIGLQSFMICEPLELEYLSSYLESFGHRVTIVDMILERRSLRSFLKRIKPQVVGLTAYITHVNVVKSYSRIIKEYNSSIVTVAGGIHAEVNPQDLDDPAIDFIAYVNGLITFRQILERLNTDSGQIKTSVAGVWNGPGKKYELDKTFSYPHPDRGKVEQYRNKYNYIFHDKCAIVKTSFGCAFTCEFCYCREITRHSYFERPLEDVILEISRIKEDNIFIVDDDFLFTRDRVMRFCSMLKEQGINKHFILFGRADFVVRNEDVIAQFRQQGLDALFMGLESFREEELADFKKKVSVEQNVAAVRILENHGIEVHSGIIVHPNWTGKDFENLVLWLKRFKMVFVNIQPLTPMPGTVLYEKKEKQITESRDNYAKWDMAHLVVDPTGMSRRQFYRNIMMTYFKTSAGPGAHLYILKKYGFQTYWRTLRGSLHITKQYVSMYLKG